MTIRLQDGLWLCWVLQSLTETECYGPPSIMIFMPC